LCEAHERYGNSKSAENNVINNFRIIFTGIKTVSILNVFPVLKVSHGLNYNIWYRIFTGAVPIRKLFWKRAGAAS